LYRPPRVTCTNGWTDENPGALVPGVSCCPADRDPTRGPRPRGCPPHGAGPAGVEPRLPGP